LFLVKMSKPETNELRKSPHSDPAMVLVNQAMHISTEKQLDAQPQDGIPFPPLPILSSDVPKMPETNIEVKQEDNSDLTKYGNINIEKKKTAEPKDNGDSFVVDDEDPVDLARDIGIQPVPIFYPTMEDFANFEAYISKVVEPKCDITKDGVCKLIPPQEWLDELMFEGERDTRRLPRVIARRQQVESTVQHGAYQQVITIFS
jgi:hypothetical protein